MTILLEPYGSLIFAFAKMSLPPLPSNLHRALAFSAARFARESALSVGINRRLYA